MMENAIIPPPAARRRKSSRPQTAISCFDGIFEGLSDIGYKDRE